MPNPFPRWLFSWARPAAPVRPTFDNARPAIEVLEDRRLLSVSGPSVSFDLDQLTPGLLMGLGTGVAGSESGTLTRHLVRTAESATDRYVLDVSVSGSYTAGLDVLNTSGSLWVDELLTVTYSVSRSDGPGDPLEVVASGTDTLDPTAVYATASFWAGFATYGADVSGYAPGRWGLTGSYPTTGWSDTVWLDATGTRVAVRDEAPATGGFAVHREHARAAGSTVSGAGTVTQAGPSSGSDSFSYSAAASYSPDGVAGPVTYTLAAAVSGTAAGNATLTWASASVPTGNAGWGATTRTQTNSSTYSEAGPSHTLAARAVGTASETATTTVAYSAGTATATVVARAGGSTGTLSDTFTQVGTLTPDPTESAAYADGTYSVASGDSGTYSGGSDRTDTVSASGSAGTVTAGVTQTLTAWSTYTQSGLLADRTGRPGGSYSLSAGDRSTATATLTDAATLSGTAVVSERTTRTATVSGGTASGTYAEWGSSATTSPGGYSLASGDGHAYSSTATATATYSAGTLTAGTTTRTAGSSGSEWYTTTESGPALDASGSFTRTDTGSGTYAANETGTLTYTGPTAFAGAVTATAGRGGSESSTYAEAGTRTDSGSATYGYRSGSSGGYSEGHTGTRSYSAGTATSEAGSAGTGRSGSEGSSYSEWAGSAGSAGTVSGSGYYAASSESGTYSESASGPANVSLGTPVPASVTVGSSRSGGDGSTRIESGSLADASGTVTGSYALWAGENGTYSDDSTGTLGQSAGTATAGVLTATDGRHGSSSSTYTEIGGVAAGTYTAGFTSHADSDDVATTTRTYTTGTAAPSVTATVSRHEGGTYTRTYTEAGTLTAAARDDRVGIAGGTYAVEQWEVGTTGLDTAGTLTLAGDTTASGTLAQTASVLGSSTAGYTESGSLTVGTTAGPLSLGAAAGGYSLAQDTGEGFSGTTTQTLTYSAGTAGVSGPVVSDETASGWDSSTYTETGSAAAAQTGVVSGDYTLDQWSTGSHARTTTQTVWFGGTDPLSSAFTMHASDDGTATSTYTEAGTQTGSGTVTGAGYTIRNVDRYDYADSAFQDLALDAAGTVTAGSATAATGRDGSSSATYSESGTLVLVRTDAAAGSYQYATRDEGTYSDHTVNTVTAVADPSATTTVTAWGSAGGGSMVRWSEGGSRVAGPSADSSSTVAGGTYTLSTSTTAGYANDGTATRYYGGETQTGGNATVSSSAGGTYVTAASDGGVAAALRSGVVSGEYLLATTEVGTFSDRQSGSFTLVGTTSAGTMTAIASDGGTSWTGSVEVGAWGDYTPADGATGTTSAVTAAVFATRDWTAGTMTAIPRAWVGDYLAVQRSYGASTDGAVPSAGAGGYAIADEVRGTYGHTNTTTAVYAGGSLTDLDTDFDASDGGDHAGRQSTYGGLDPDPDAGATGGVASDDTERNGNYSSSATGHLSYSDGTLESGDVSLSGAEWGDETDSASMSAGLTASDWGSSVGSRVVEDDRTGGYRYGSGYSADYADFSRGASTLTESASVSGVFASKDVSAGWSLSGTALVTDAYSLPGAAGTYDSGFTRTGYYSGDALTSQHEVAYTSERGSFSASSTPSAAIAFARTATYSTAATQTADYTPGASGSGTQTVTRRTGGDNWSTYSESGDEDLVGLSLAEGRYTLSQTDTGTYTGRGTFTETYASGSGTLTGTLAGVVGSYTGTGTASATYTQTETGVPLGELGTYSSGYGDVGWVSQTESGTVSSVSGTSGLDGSWWSATSTGGYSETGTAAGPAETSGWFTYVSAGTGSSTAAYAGSNTYSGGSYSTGGGTASPWSSVSGSDSYSAGWPTAGSGTSGVVGSQAYVSWGTGTATTQDASVWSRSGTGPLSSTVTSHYREDDTLSQSASMAGTLATLPTNGVAGTSTTWARGDDSYTGTADWTASYTSAAASGTTVPVPLLVSASGSRTETLTGGYTTADSASSSYTPSGSPAYADRNSVTLSTGYTDTLTYALATGTVTTSGTPVFGSSWALGSSTYDRTAGRTAGADVASAETNGTWSGPGFAATSGQSATLGRTAASSETSGWSYHAVGTPGSYALAQTQFDTLGVDDIRSASYSAGSGQSVAHAGSGWSDSLTATVTAGTSGSAAGVSSTFRAAGTAYAAGYTTGSTFTTATADAATDGQTAVYARSLGGDGTWTTAAASFAADRTATASASYHAVDGAAIPGWAGAPSQSIGPYPYPNSFGGQGGDLWATASGQGAGAGTARTVDVRDRSSASYHAGGSSASYTFSNDAGATHTETTVGTVSAAGTVSATAAVGTGWWSSASVAGTVSAGTLTGGTGFSAAVRSDSGSFVGSRDEDLSPDPLGESVTYGFWGGFTGTRSSTDSVSRSLAVSGGSWSWGAPTYAADRSSSYAGSETGSYGSYDVSYFGWSEANTTSAAESGSDTFHASGSGSSYGFTTGGQVSGEDDWADRWYYYGWDASTSTYLYEDSRTYTAGSAGSGSSAGGTAGYATYTRSASLEYLGSSLEWEGGTEYGQWSGNDTSGVTTGSGSSGWVTGTWEYWNQCLGLDPHGSGDSYSYSAGLPSTGYTPSGTGTAASLPVGYYGSGGGYQPSGPGTGSFDLLGSWQGTRYGDVMSLAPVVPGSAALPTVDAGTWDAPDAPNLGPAAPATDTPVSYEADGMPLPEADVLHGVDGVLGIVPSWGIEAACFAAGTPLLTPGGWTAIEVVRVGDVVLSRPEHDPAAAADSKVVEEVFVRRGVLWDVRAGGQVIRTTAEHPFWAAGRGWVPARELRAGDELSGHDGQAVTVDAVADTGEEAAVYNLRVADWHTYFVGCDDWGFSVWAHNQYGAADPAEQRKQLEQQLAKLRKDDFDAYLKRINPGGGQWPGGKMWPEGYDEDNNPAIVALRRQLAQLGAPPPAASNQNAKMTAVMEDLGRNEMAAARRAGEVEVERVRQAQQQQLLYNMAVLFATAPLGMGGRAALGVGLGTATRQAGLLAAREGAGSLAAERAAALATKAPAAAKPVIPAGPVYEEVAIVGPNGKLGEFDKIYPGLFVEEKTATGISKGLKFSGKTYAQAAEDWAASNVYKKTATRINNIPKATQVIPEKGPARPVPDLAQIQSTKKFHFKIDETNPDLMSAVNKQVEQLRKDFPGYEFTVEFGK